MAEQEAAAATAVRPKKRPDTRIWAPSRGPIEDEIEIRKEVPENRAKLAK